MHCPIVIKANIMIIKYMTGHAIYIGKGISYDRDLENGNETCFLMLLLERTDIIWKISMKSSGIRCNENSHLASRNSGYHLGEI